MVGFERDGRGGRGARDGPGRYGVVENGRQLPGVTRDNWGCPVMTGVAGYDRCGQG